MTASILTTKLNTPLPTSKLIPRPTLIEKLNQGLAYPLTLISAPAGYGKTTLIAEWIHNLQDSKDGCQSCWLSLDENDNDPIRFLVYLSAALQKVNPDINQIIMAMMEAPRPPPPEALLTTLINEIASVDQQFILAIDDYHLIRSLPIHTQVAFILEHQPAHMHLVIASREDPPLPLPRLRARRQLIEIRQDDLRFSAVECAGFLQQVMGLDLSNADITALERRTEGWAAGLQLAALAMQAPGTNKGRDELHSFVQSFSGSNRFILDYLIEEVIERQPHDVQDFLLKTSILKRFTAPLCDAVVARSGSHVLLHALEHANLFVVPLDQTREWYRYHRLFSELLQRRLRDMDPDALFSLNKRAGYWFEEHGYIYDAVEHSLAAKDWSDAARLVGLASAEAIRNGQFAMLNSWLDALPEEIVCGDLSLAITKGWISLLMGDIKGAGDYADLADGLLGADTPADSLAPLKALRASLALNHTDIANAIKLSQETLDLIKEPDDYGLRGMVLNIMAQAQMYIGDISAATETYSEMVRQSQAAGHPLTAASAKGNLAALLNQAGKLHQAITLCQGALDQCKGPHERLMPVAGYALIPLGWFLFEANDLAEAQENLIKGLELGEQLGPMSGIPVSGRLLLAQTQYALGKKEEAIKLIAELRQMITQLNLAFVEFQIAGIEARMKLKEGDLAAIERWALMAGYTPESAPNHLQEDDHFTYIRFLIKQNQLVEADAFLANYEQFADQGNRQRSLITIYNLQALVKQASGDSKGAISRLELALRLAAPEGYRRVFLDEGQALIELMPKVRHLAPEFVDQLLSDVRNEVDLHLPSPLAQPLVEPLSDRELEVLRFVCDGLSNSQIAEKLIISVGTVKTHVHNIYGKLEVGGRPQAIARARELELL